jgi:hypothetical protein
MTLLASIETVRGGISARFDIRSQGLNSRMHGSKESLADRSGVPIGNANAIKFRHRTH